MDLHREIREKYQALEPLLNERLRRAWAASEAEALGYGGVSAVAEATGLNRRTIGLGRVDLATLGTADGVPAQRVRRTGGGRKPLIEHDPLLVEALDRLV